MDLGIKLAVLEALALSGCREQGRDDADPLLVDVQEADVEMQAAIAQAQASLEDFLKVLRRPTQDQTSFLIKGRFDDGENVEHIWIADITWDGKAFRGVIANQPRSISGLSFKQEVEITDQQVTDWMYIEDERLIGGFTSRVLRSRLSDEQRRIQDARVPYKYD